MNSVKRFIQNPILIPDSLNPAYKDMVIECILNPGAFIFENKTWLLLRVAERPVKHKGIVSFPINDSNGNISVINLPENTPGLNCSDPRIISYEKEDYLTTISYLRLVCSDDGINFYEPEGYPYIYGLGEYETYGIEDCRVAFINEIFHLTYTSVSKNGVAVGLMTTKDWKNFVRHGIIIPPHNKDCALFEKQINGKYYMLHRPSSPQIGGNYIWIASSNDLEHWGKHHCIAHTRKDMWDSVRVGAGASPIETEKGWLIIYHGADENNRYCLGALLLDKNIPTKVIARSVDPVMEPEMDYELNGFFGNVVFTNGHIVSGDKLTIYYGASDEVICGAELSINAILENLGV